jgi:epoxyqueuosine reductase
MQPERRSERVIERARALGFDLCGIAAPEDFAELERLPEWLARGYAGEMAYLSDARRRDPALALAGTRSVIVCAVNYNTPAAYSTDLPAIEDEKSGPRGWISRYAWGSDYHEIVGKMLEALLAALRADFAGEDFAARAYVDTGPVVERVAARAAGLGWLAKNTCLIHEQLGSWLFLGVILTTFELAPTRAADGAPPDLCGNCRLCLDACPTQALVEPYVLDARRCISYLTIELRGVIPEELRAPMGRMVFGCDICQDVCPWNRKAPVSTLAAFLPRALPFEDASEPAAASPATAPDSLLAPPLERLASLSEGEFRMLFRGSAVKRAKWRGLVRNACVALGNAGVRAGSTTHARVTSLLERLAGSGDDVIAEHARWALAHLRSASGGGSAAARIDTASPTR